MRTEVRFDNSCFYPIFTFFFLICMSALIVPVSAVQDAANSPDDPVSLIVPGSPEGQNALYTVQGSHGNLPEKR